MALRRMLGWSEGDLMRSDAKPCSRLMRQTAGIFSVGGALAFWVLCKLHYGPRITRPRILRWAACGSITWLAGRSTRAFKSLPSGCVWSDYLLLPCENFWRRYRLNLFDELKGYLKDKKNDKVTNGRWFAS